AARSALRARISIATRMPTATPMKMPYQGLFSTSQLTRTPTMIAATSTPIIHGNVVRSTSWVYLNTSIICLKRPGFLGPSFFFVLSFAAPLVGLLSLLRAMWGGVPLGGVRASARDGLIRAGDDARGFLTGGLILVQVAEV